jgi:major type 1 subunit fimbrin (pilin)
VALKEILAMALLVHGTGDMGGDATLSFSAAYVTTGAAGTATAGRGNATLPFVLQYE